MHSSMWLGLEAVSSLERCPYSECPLYTGSTVSCSGLIQTVGHMYQAHVEPEALKIN